MGQTRINISKRSARWFAACAAISVIFVLKTASADPGTTVPDMHPGHSTLHAHSAHSLNHAPRGGMPRLSMRFRLPTDEYQTAAQSGITRLPPVSPRVAFQSPPGSELLMRSEPQSPVGPEYSIPIRDGSEESNVDITATDGVISLVARDTPVSQVLAIIARTQNLNIVFAAQSDTRITVSLDKVTVGEALSSILNVAGYMWRTDQQVIYVTSISDARGVHPSVQGRQIKVFDLDFVAAADVDLAIKGLLSPTGSSYISQSSPTDNRRTKEVVVVEDLPSYVDRIGEYIAQVDQAPRQVMIQVHILQVDLDENNRNGVDFEALSRHGDTDFSIRTSGFANPAAPQAFFLELSGGELTGLVEILQSTTDAKTLASPRVLAINGQESRIQIGEQLGFRVTTTTETSTLESVDFLDLGVVLRVTPRISRDGRVLMRVKPEGPLNPTCRKK